LCLGFFIYIIKFMIIDVKIYPNSREEKVEQQADGTFHVRVSGRPIDGRANSDLIDILSEYFEVSRGRIKIKKGLRSRFKIVEII